MGVGTALLPYYKTILPLINGFKNRSSKCYVVPSLASALGAYAQPCNITIPTGVQTRLLETRWILATAPTYKPQSRNFLTRCVKQEARQHLRRSDRDHLARVR